MHIYSVYVQRTSDEMPDKSQAGIKTARSNINNLRYADDTTLMVKEESKKVVLKLNIQENKIMTSGP